MRARKKTETNQEKINKKSREKSGEKIRGKNPWEKSGGKICGKNPGEKSGKTPGKKTGEKSGGKKCKLRFARILTSKFFSQIFLPAFSGRGFRGSGRPAGLGRLAGLGRPGWARQAGRPATQPPSWLPSQMASSGLAGGSGPHAGFQIPGNG